MIKVLPCWFRKCLGPFRMLTLERYSETRLFRHLSNHVCCSLIFLKHINYEIHIFLSKCSIFDVKFRNEVKTSEIFFCFLDNYIWVDCHKFSLLRREYLSSRHRESMCQQTVLRFQILLFSEEFRYH